VVRHAVVSFYLAGMTLATAPVALADEPSPEPVEEEESVFDFLNPAHEYWSARVADYAGRMDRFFGDDRNFLESNESVVQLDLVQSLKEGGDRDLRFSGRAKLSLPATKKRLHLLVETDPEEIATGAATDQGTVVPRQITSKDSYAAAVRYQQDEEDRWHFSTDAGVRLRSKLDTYTRLRGSGSVFLGQWRFTPAETLFWFRTIGPGESTRLDIERAFTPSILFRAGSNATWLQDDRSFTVRQDLSLYHTLDTRRALVYQVSMVGTTQPLTQMEEYVALVRYRYRLHEDWLFAEISPQMHYPVELDYHPDPQLLLDLEMLFGGRPGL
jgi:hypothetical protein